MGWVLQRSGDGAYVAPSGSSSSYTRDLKRAKRYATREQAEADACGNEYATRAESHLTRIG